MPRSTEEWIARTPDTRIPPRVRQRIFDRDHGICCECKLAIKTGETWQADHRIALINGGEHRETNLAPIHAHCHLGKTAADVKVKAKIAKVRARHTGVKTPAGNLKGPGFAKADKPARTSAKPALPPRAMFWPTPTTQREEVRDAE